MWPPPPREHPIIEVPEETLDDVLSFNMDWVDAMEKFFQQAEERLDKFRISSNNKDELQEIFKDLKKVSHDIDHFLQELDESKIDSENKTLREVKKKLVERVIDLAEEADTCMRKCQHYHDEFSKKN